MIKIQKGTKDVLPNESYKWHFLENIIKNLAKKKGFLEIRTPIFEATELFIRGIGTTTDIVNKEMYTFLDKGNRSITLKPEGTAPVVRSYIENNLKQQRNPLKVYYITPVFRYERPQSGRLREHHQFGVEVFGANSYLAELEVILLANTLFCELGIKNIELRINNIGCEVCRKDYNVALREYYKQNFDKLCGLCQERLDRNPLRILDCKNPGCIEVNKLAPSISNYLCDDCKQHNSSLLGALEDLKIPFIYDDKIVRGLDYYTGTVFEFISSHLGAMNTVCGGGRYNNLVSEIGGETTPAIGFGLGLERLMTILESINLNFAEEETPLVYIANVGDENMLDCFKLAIDFQKENISAESNLSAKSLKAQMKTANKLGYKYVLVVGNEELKDREYTLKFMEEKREFRGSFEEIVKFIHQINH